MDIVTLPDVVEAVAGRLGGGKPLFVASANLDHLHHFGSGSPHAGMFDDRDRADWLVLLDGMPLVWTARRLTGEPCEQLAGSDLLPLLLAVAERRSATLGVFGGAPDMHAALRSALVRRFPALPVAGMWAPDRSDLSDPRRAAGWAERVRAAGVDLLVVALGKPHAEVWLHSHGPDTGAHVALQFGAACDFLAGRARRAPRTLQHAGLEWLFRLSREPRRLSRRYLVNGPADLVHLLRDSEVCAPAEAPARAVSA